MLKPCLNCTSIFIADRSKRQYCSSRCYTSHKGFKKRLKPYEHVYKRMLRNSSNVALSFDDFLTFTNIRKCHYCDGDVYWNEYREKRDRTQAYNLDRMNNLVGYVKSNLVVCCRKCNFGKGNRYTYDEWKIMMTALTQYRAAQG